METTYVEPAADNAAQDVGGQYSIGRILGIWAAAAAPMGLILWVVMPLLVPHLGAHPGFAYLVLITAGLVWQGVLALLILRREVRPFTWANLRRRLWLNVPIQPRTGRPAARLLWLTVPAILFLFAWDSFGVLDWLNDAWVRALPFLAPPDYALIENLAGPAKGQWWLLGVLPPLILFNYLLGEELIFRGILLPKMRGAFGRWDWVANGVLFTAYHVHLIWTLPSQIIIRDWVYPLLVKRYRSYWLSVIVHGFDGVVVTALFTLAIMGKV